MTFEEFQKTRTWCKDLSKALPEQVWGDATEKGWLYLGELHVEQVGAHWPENSRAAGEWYLCIGNREWIKRGLPGLQELERHLYEFAVGEGYTLSDAAQPQYLKEFPDFDPATMPAVPEGWTDTSWHNDSCPSFNTGKGTVVFVDFADVALREIQEPNFVRYHVQADAEVHNHNEGLFESDDWNAVLEFVNRVDTVAREFAQCLIEELGKNKVREVNKRNAEHTANGKWQICASHDFCDANMTMLLAFTDSGVATANQVMDDVGVGGPLTQIWNTAWGHASHNKFWIS